MGKKSGSSQKSSAPIVSKSAEKRLKKAQDAQQASINAFNRFYSEQYGSTRWETLIESLKRPVRYCALVNRYVNSSFVFKLLEIESNFTIAYFPDALFNAYIRNPIISSSNISGSQVTKSLEGEVSSETDAAIHEETVFNLSGIKESLQNDINAAYDEGDKGTQMEPTVCSDEQSSDNCEVTKSQNLMQNAVEKNENADVDIDDEDVIYLLEDEQMNSHESSSSIECKRSAALNSVGWVSPGISTSLDPSNGLCCYYPLDAASLLPVEMLNVTSSCKVLDVCSAPGGKALAIMQRLGLEGALYCNDISPERRIRLKTVIRRYIPKPLSNIVNVIGYDATSKRFLDEFGEGSFDRILLDAPCSSERHLIHKPNELRTWAQGRSKGNAERQLALLLNACKLLRVGGRIVYSTCSLSKWENDDVVRKAIRKGQNKLDAEIRICTIDVSKLPFGEATEFGCHILPDVCDGWGPIYFAVLEKV